MSKLLSLLIFLANVVIIIVMILQIVSRKGFRIRKNIFKVLLIIICCVIIYGNYKDYRIKASYKPEIIKVREIARQLTIDPSSPRDEFPVIKLIADIEISRNFKKAESLFNSKNYFMAESLFYISYQSAQSLENDTFIGLALLGLGTSKGMQSKYSEAAIDLNRCLKYKKQINNKIIEFNIVISEIYFNIGFYHQVNDAPNKAIKNYCKSIVFNPMNFDALYNIGIVYLQEGDFKNAISNFSSAISINPSFANAYNNRGVAYLNKGKFNEALQDFDIAINLNQYLSEAYANRGIVYAELSDWVNAISDFTTVILTYKDYDWFFYNFAFCYYKINELDKAALYYNMAINLNPNNYDAFNNLGVIYADIGMLDNSIKCFIKAGGEAFNYMSKGNLGIAYAIKDGFYSQNKFGRSYRYIKSGASLYLKFHDALYVIGQLSDMYNSENYRKLDEYWYIYDLQYGNIKPHSKNLYKQIRNWIDRKIF